MIALHDVNLAYTAAGQPVPVLNSVRLSVNDGDSIAIVGPSGSGKTSLLLVLTGLETPDSGEVEIHGHALHSLDADARADLRREHIGIVFQSFHLIPSLTALDNVALPLDIANAAHGRDVAAQMLERVGLKHRLSHYPNALSGGERQRVAIARALVHKPALIVADEPTGNLDGPTGDAIADLLFELNLEYQATLVLVTHDPALANRCQRQVTLQAGTLST